MKITIERKLTPVPCARRTEPTRRLYAGHVYTPSHQTDIAARFKAIRESARCLAIDGVVTAIQQKRRNK